MKIKIKSKPKFIFWIVMYILWYLFAFIYLNIFSPIAESKIGYISGNVALYNMSSALFIGIVVLFFIGLFVLWQTDLKDKRLTKWVMGSIVLDIILYNVAVIIKEAILGEDWIITIIASIGTYAFIGIVSYFIYKYKKKNDQI